MLRRAASEVAQDKLPDAGLCFFDLKHDLPDAWHRLQSGHADASSPRQLSLRLSRNMFPYLPGDRELHIHHLELLFEAPGAEPSAHHSIEFLIGDAARDPRQCEVQTVECIASADWPGLYHGVLEVPLGSLTQAGYHDLGTVRFPSDIGEIQDVFLFCGYHVNRTQEPTA